jgi:hypothetical protein
MPSNLRSCIPVLEFTQATKLELQLYHELTKQQRRGLNILDLQKIMTQLPQKPSIGSPNTTGPSLLRWSEFLVACHDYDPAGITKAFRNFLLETLDVSADRVDGGLDDTVKVMFSSSTQFTGFRGQIYTLRNLTDDPAYAGYRFELEVYDYLTKRRIDIVLVASDGKRTFVEVKAYEHWEFDSDAIWTKLLGETGQFTRDLFGAIKRSASIDELFDDLLYFFPDPDQYPNVDLDRVRNEFLNPFILSGPTYELVPQLIKGTAADKGYDLVEVYVRLEAKLNADMIRTYTTP